LGKEQETAIHKDIKSAKEKNTPSKKQKNVSEIQKNHLEVDPSTELINSLDETSNPKIPQLNESMMILNLL